MYSAIVLIEHGTSILDSSSFEGDWQAYTKDGNVHVTFDVESDLKWFNAMHTAIKND